MNRKKQDRRHDGADGTDAREGGTSDRPSPVDMLGTRHVAGIGDMQFLVDGRGRIYALQVHHLSNAKEGMVHPSPYGGMACITVDASDAPPHSRPPCSRTSHSGDELRLLTDSDGRPFSGMQMVGFEENLPSLDSEEARYVVDDIVTSSSGRVAVRAGYSAFYQGMKYLAPTAEFIHDEAGLARTSALHEARIFARAVASKVEAFGGHVLLRMDEGNVYGDPGHAVVVLIPFSIARQSGTPEAWLVRLADLIDVPRSS